MGTSSRTRFLSRALIVAVVVVLLAGLTVVGRLWQRGRSVAATAPVPAAGSPTTTMVAPPSPSAAVVASPSDDASAVPVPAMSLVADVAVPTLPVYGAPAVGKVLAQVPSRNAMDQTEALLVVDDSVPGWYRVQVPVRPNGSEGWVQASQVTIRQDASYLRVYQSKFRLEYYVGGTLVRAFRVAVGAPSTPTPYGRFYVWASEDDTAAPYNPGIFALSAFSPVLENWPGGGRTGIHGWTDTSILGRRASHGCVRMAPADFAQLLHTVPLGTPVDILT